MLRWLMVSLVFVAAVVWWVMSQRSQKADLAVAEAHAKDAFAEDRSLGFDADRALRYLKEVCDLGPRISDTDGMKKQRDLLRKHFEALGAKVVEQRFSARQASRPDDIDMVNLMVSWHPERTRRVLVSCHYDTRPVADEEPLRSNWTKPFLGANDGASGVAFLMELAHHLKAIQPAVGVDFIFFDGEEYILEKHTDRYFLGSEYFAREYRQNRPKHRYAAGVLVDMIAGKKPRFPIERNSWWRAAPLTQDLWKIAAEQKCSAFVPIQGPEVRDDHLALNNAGIPTVDIIDFEGYQAHWHRLSDRPENCSAEGLDQVGRVLMVWLKRFK